MVIIVGNEYGNKSWTTTFAFCKALILLGKVWIQLFSLPLWLNSWADWALQPWYGNWFGGDRGVMVIVVGNGHGDTSSNPGRDW